MGWISHGATVEQQHALVEEEAYRCGANAIPLELHVSYMK